VGGTLTTVYNTQGVATEGQLRDAQGQLVARIVRTFDAGGKLTLEKEIVDKPEVTFDEERVSELNAAQKKTLAAWMVGTLYSGQVSSSYDPQGRLTEKRQSGGVFGEQVTTITYNDRGDKAAERTTIVGDPNVGREFQFNDDGTVIPVGNPTSVPPSYTETRYAYQYDSYGNWTQQTAATRYGADAPLGPGSTRSRKLKYY